MKVHVLNCGGTLGMTGKPLRPAKTAAELFEGILVPPGVDANLVDFERREDSTNTMHADRVQMAEVIAAAYAEFDTFIVLHGTDSLSLTTSAISLIFKRSLQKAAFVIGAQMTKDEPGSDVPMQISNTLRIADAFHRHGIVAAYNI